MGLSGLDMNVGREGGSEEGEKWHCLLIFFVCVMDWKEGSWKCFIQNEYEIEHCKLKGQVMMKWTLRV